MGNINIGGRLHSTAAGNVVAGANEILDDTQNKKQNVINSEVNVALTNLDGRIDTLEEDMGTGGAVDTRIENAINALNATKSQTAGADGLALSITQTEGKIASISGSIASGTYDASGAANTAKTEVIGGATSSGNTLKKLEDRVSPLETAVGNGGSVDTRIATAKSEIIGDAASDYNTLGKLEDKIQAEVTRATGAENAINEVLEDCAYIRSNDGTAVIADFDPQTDTVWKKAQVLSSAERSQVQQNINVYDKSQTYTKTEVNGLVSTPHQNYVTVATYASLPATGSEDTIYRVSNYDGANSQVDITKYSEYAWNGSAYMFLRVESSTDEVFDISVYNSNAKYDDLADALGTNGANVPAEVRRGGMSIKYVSNSDNKYVRCNYLLEDATTNSKFVNVANWQGVDVELVTNEKRNLVEGNGVSKVINSIYKSGITWDNGHYYKSDKTKGAADGFQCVSIDLTYIDSVILKNIYNNGDATYCFLIYNNGTIKQQWNNQIIDSVTLDTSDCNLLLISNRKTNKDWEIGFEYADVRELLDIPKGEAEVYTDRSIDVLDHSLSVPLFEKIDIGINVTSGIALNYKYDINIKQGTRLKLTLETTALIASGGVNFVLGYTDGTTGTGTMNPSAELTLQKDIKYLSFNRSVQGVVGTGTIHISLSDVNSLEAEVKSQGNEIVDIKDNLTLLNDVAQNVLLPIDINVPTISGQKCDYAYNISISSGNSISVHLLQTNLLATGGFNLFLGYTDETESSAHPLEIDGTYTETLSKDLKYLRFVRSAQGVIGTGNVIVNFKNNDSIANQVPLPPLYVSATNGNDSNDGKSISTAKKTINAALESGGSRILVQGGVYKERIDLRKSTSKDVSITGIEGENPVIIMPSNSVIYDSGDEETVSGYENVCEISVDVDLSDADARLFFDGMNDVTTAITSQEVHPCQRGKTYRCDSTMLIPTDATTLSDALIEINTSDVYKFYYDSSEQKLYFKKPTSPTNIYPLVFPRHHATHFAYTSYEYSLNLTNIEFKYAKVNVDGLENVCISDCSSKYVYSNGCFSYDNSMNVEFIRCEAARAYHGEFGDGFNSSTIHTQTSRGCSAKMENCWSHDNNDDGYSDHDGQNTIIEGGLYEYNGKGGITPARGSSCICNNVYSRHNYNGFYYILGAPTANEGSMMLYNCISESNDVSGFRVENGQNAILYNCIAINEVIGYKCQSGSVMRLIDCKQSGCTTVKDGNINIINGSIVE